MATATTRCSSVTVVFGSRDEDEAAEHVAAPEHGELGAVRGKGEPTVWPVVLHHGDHSAAFQARQRMAERERLELAAVATSSSSVSSFWAAMIMSAEVCRPGSPTVATRWMRRISSATLSPAAYRMATE